MTRYVFFSGKGGVGKTSLSSAMAVMLAANGAKTLLVTTDPASNLGDVFGQEVGLEAREVRGVPNLFIQEINPDAALQSYKDRALGPLREVFPEEFVRTAEEKMSGPCTEEIATFDQFIACMHQPDYEWVVFDTAPTGHTLRLLELPSSWSLHIEESAQGSGQTCIGSVDALAASKEQYDNAVRALQDPNMTTFVFVTQPAKLPMDEMLRSVIELQKLEISNQVAIVNGVIPEDERDHPYSRRRWQKQEPHIQELQSRFDGPIGYMPLYPDEVKGMAMLEQVGRDLQYAVHL
ncbi:ArsA family ATPase [Alicyclobacillus sp. SO9]|uniref:ArsA family ATPase n=1 Tax=Alicyclobacillus sp. SO9 TaxID=2665646 RepID=UPI0018E78390|nr:ArsA family ATPase [Alicyclobacillus sp. SO9]QQE78313.1 ArsA family ATPase [Alicyclobacillus sp. SO9]